MITVRTRLRRAKSIRGAAAADKDNEDKDCTDDDGDDDDEMAEAVLLLVSVDVEVTRLTVAARRSAAFVLSVAVDSSSDDLACCKPSAGIETTSRVLGSLAAFAAAAVLALVLVVFCNDATASADFGGSGGR